MKKELRRAMQEGIRESELNGYKWTVTPTGLKWSYCDEEFTFTMEENGYECQVLAVRAVQSGMHMVSLMIGKEWYCDASSVEDAYRIATEATIRKANHLY